MKQHFTSKSIFHPLRGLRRSKTVKANLLLLCVAFASTPLLSAQINCASYIKQGTGSQTFQTNVTQGPLVCQYPFNATALAQTYFGGNFAQLPPSQQATANAIFTGLVSAGTTATAPFNSSIASQLAQLPMPSAAVGTVTLRLSPNDPGTPFNNLGPILTDRPDTVPKHQYFLSFAYQHFNFTQINGLQLNNLSLAASLLDTPVPGSLTTDCTKTACGTFYAGLTSNISFQMDQYIGLLTYGLTRSMDVSVAVPINSVSMKATSTQYNAFLYAPSSSQTQPYYVLATFNPNSPSAQTPLITSGSATGIGDVAVNVKQMLLGQEGHYAVAAGVQLRFPTGDSSNYLGSGAYGANVYTLIEYRGSYHGIGIAPHMKFGYQWNTQSQVMDITSKPHLNLPGGLDYAFGTDIGLYHNLRKYRNLTLSVDGVGHQYVNAPNLTASSISLPTPPATQTGIVVPPTLATVTPGTSTYTTFNFSSGLKFQVQRHILLYGNILVPINNVGLHSDPVPLVGIGIK